MFSVKDIICLLGLLLIVDSAIGTRKNNNNKEQGVQYVKLIADSKCDKPTGENVGEFPGFQTAQAPQKKTRSGRKHFTMSVDPNYDRPTGQNVGEFPGFNPGGQGR